MFKLNNSEASKISTLFKETECTILKSYMHGYSGKCYVDNVFSPKNALVCQNPFHFIGGKLNTKFAEDIVCYLPQGAILICDDPEWYGFIQTFPKIKSRRLTRYKFYRDKNHFDLNKLKEYSESLPEGYTIEYMNRDFSHDSFLSDLSKDLLGVFDSTDDYLEKGCGFIVLYEERPVCGASSFSRYDTGIEIQVDTHPDHRKKGLATAAAAKLMLHCFSNNIHPNWDAENLLSVKLAEKLGYIMKSPYSAMLINEVIV